MYRRVYVRSEGEERENMTPCREDCIKATKRYADLVKVDTILEIGLAGDAFPSGSYEYFKDFKYWKTLDKHKKYNPDIVFDLEEDTWKEEPFDLVICLNVLEHVFFIIDAIDNLRRMTGKYLIVGTPWNYPYHPDESFDDYYRFTPAFFKKLLKAQGMELVEDNSTDNFVCLLFKKV
jgi:hypothetical protein